MSQSDGSDGSTESPARQIFAAAVGLDAPARESLLNARCGTNGALREEVESLLRFHSDDGFLERPALEDSGLAGAGGPIDRLPAGVRVGAYVIVNALGAGGMGVVYRAEQDAPRRQVALKLIRPAAMTHAAGGARRRFAREAAALGRLRHPGIARIFEAGAAEIGGVEAPYLAMELVEGEPLTRAARPWSVRQRLEMMAQICDAVAHAHERGVVHRDLKPGNIIIEEGPGGPSPKILDFGVARIVAAEDADERPVTRHTRAGQLIGTLTYMSPEQAAGEADLIDTRSDVYSLGVILYELLAGRPPLDLSGATIPAAARAIAEQEPALLGTVDRGLRGDIETIVRKALEKDPARRYAGASALADDIRRHLDDLPVAARPPSAVVQIRKFSRRHRSATAAVVTVALVLTASVAGLAVLLARARLAEAGARREAIRAGAVAEFLDDMLEGIAPDVAQGMDTDLLRAILDRASARVGAYSDHPLVDADIRTVIAASYEAAGFAALARPHAEAAFILRREALGASHLDTIRAMIRVGEIDYELGDLAAALDRTRDAEARALATVGEGHDVTLWAQSNIVVCTSELGRPEEVDDLSLRVLDGRRRLWGPDHPDTLLSMGVRMHLLWDLGREAEAAKLGEETLEARTRALGADHPETLISANNLASLYDDLGRRAEAIAMHERILDSRRRLLGPDHPATLASMNNLAAAFDGSEAGDAERQRAEALYLEVFERSAGVFGETHINRALTAHNLATLYRRQQRYDEAAPFSQLAAEMARASLPAEHWQVGALQASHGATLTFLGRLEEAETLLLEAHAIIDAAVGGEHRAARSAAASLVRLYERSERPDEARRWGAAAGQEAGGG
jgi:serine/threonine protein kinase